MDSGSFWTNGPSPRLRGKRCPECRLDLDARSIPAPAGETRPLKAALQHGEVHPRACGGNSSPPAASCFWAGPSPRLRGKLEVKSWPAAEIGSIPAPAGKRSVALFICLLLWSIPAPAGKPFSCFLAELSDRSIPAPAGETSRRRFPVESPKVHPRACGETWRSPRCCGVPPVHPRACGGNGTTWNPS